MKRVIGLLVFVLFLNSCDDGDLTMEDINFDDITTIEHCTTNDILYKLKEKESLLLDIPESEFINNPTLPNEPILIDIDNSTYRVIYRFYNGVVSTDNICNTIPPATPNVTDQWTATSGKIQIITTPIKTTNTTENSTRITGYNHNITFKNITFARTGGNQVYETFPFGNYITDASDLSLSLNDEVKQCIDSKQLYNYIVNGTESLTIDNIDPSLIVNTETPINTPRTALIGAVNNKLTYRSYSSILPNNYFCNATTPILPAVKEEWNGVNGVAGVSGIIEVTTVKSGSIYKHTIVLKKVTLKKGNSDFKLGDNFKYGDLETND
ncbi:MAG: hypothetical protein V4572_06100 [Bacteroidota bacterium]